MKKASKKVLCLVLVLVLACSTAFVFAACDHKPAPEAGNKSVTLVIVNAEGVQTVVTDKTDAEYVDKWLEELNTESKITLTFTTSQYGMNISKLNGIAVNGSDTYFGFYANDADNTNEAWGTYVYGDKTLASCSYGQSSMPVKDGCIYALVYTAYIG